MLPLGPVLVSSLVYSLVLGLVGFVILSPSSGVQDVHDEHLRSRELPDGRGYLPPSITRILRRFDARSTGGDAHLAA